jgi:mRNA interferase RelE/StbE
MAWKIEFTDIADKQLSKLDRPVKNRIINWLDERLTNCDNPKLWGDALVGELSGMWRYRIGDYRVICELRDNELVVLVIELGHRREIYK